MIGVLKSTLNVMLNLCIMDLYNTLRGQERGAYHFGMHDVLPSVSFWAFEDGSLLGFLSWASLGH